MIYRRALIQELSLTSGASLVVLIAISLVTLFIRLLGEAARGEIANEAVFTFLGFSLLHFLPVLLSVALFIGVLMTLMRYWRDSEMVIWSGAGLSLTDWIKPVLMFAVPMVLILVLLTNTIIPWAISKKDTYKSELRSRNDASAVTPGIFAETNNGDRVYFVENLNPLTGTVGNVFMQSKDSGKLGVVVAAEGEQRRLDDGTRFLLLSKGRRYEGTPGQKEYRIIRFERYWIRLDPVEAKVREKSVSQIGTLDLFGSKERGASGELVGRLNVPLSAAILVLLAIPLSYVNPRANRSYGLVAALLLYFIYNNLMSISQAWVAQDKLSLLSGLLLAHVPIIAALAAFYAYRMRIGPFRARGWS
jgi:lipopolysaccharide export system permease protein